MQQFNVTTVIIKLEINASIGINPLELHEKLALKLKYF